MCRRLRTEQHEYCREMLRIKRSVAASFSQIHYNTTLVEATTAPATAGSVLTMLSAGCVRRV